MNNKRKLLSLHFFAKIFSTVSFAIIVTIVMFIFASVFYRARGSFSIEFMLSEPKGFPLGSAGGVFPAIIGSLYFTSIATVFATVISLAIAIYLVFYCRSLRLREIIEVVIGVIAGIPSIILGLFGYSFLVVYLGLGISVLSGGLVLALMIFPYIEIKFERIFEDVKSRYFINAKALGVNDIFFIFNIAIPVAWRNLLSTISLSASLAMGATAPILLTGAVFYARVPKTIFSPAMALPLHLYYLVGESISLSNAFATAGTLLIILILLNITTWLLSYWRKDT